MKPCNLANQKFGKLKAIKRIQNNKQNKAQWACICDCGKEVIVPANRLKNGRTKSCGCLRIEILNNYNKIHGLCKHPLYKIWYGIKQRCYYIKGCNYKNYGARGIRLYEEWLNNPENFINWAKQNGWNNGLVIDRINNDGNYEPNNCRFVTHRQNSSNTRKQKNKNLPAGITKRGNKFLANINIYLGSFDTKEDAVIVYNSAIKKYGLL